MTELSLSEQPTIKRYSAVARALHWLVLLLLLVQYPIAWNMPEIGRGTTPDRLISMHLSFGLLILFLIALRLVWRLVRTPPPPPPDLPAWQHVLSRLVHWALYLLLIVIPIMGWINASWRGWHINFFGLFELPHLIASRDAATQSALAGAWTGNLHKALAFGLLALTVVHILAALYHRVILRDGVFARMWPPV